MLITEIKEVNETCQYLGKMCTYDSGKDVFFSLGLETHYHIWSTICDGAS